MDLYIKRKCGIEYTMATNKYKNKYATSLFWIFNISVIFTILLTAGLYWQNKQSVKAEELFGSADLKTFISTFYPWAIQICGGIAIFIIIWAGYLYVTSAGNVEQNNKAKDYIVNTLIGLAFLICSGLIYQTIKT